MRLRIRRRVRNGGKRAIEDATAATTASRARAAADRASEQRGAARDARLIATLQAIRAENHFAATVAAAFRGEQ